MHYLNFPEQAVSHKQESTIFVKLSVLTAKNENSCNDMILLGNVMLLDSNFHKFCLQDITLESQGTVHVS